MPLGYEFEAPFKWNVSIYIMEWLKSDFKCEH